MLRIEKCVFWMTPLPACPSLKLMYLSTNWPFSILLVTWSHSSQYNDAAAAFLPIPARQAPSALRLCTIFLDAILPATHADSLGQSCAAFSIRSDNAISLPFLGTKKRSPLFWKGEILWINTWHLSSRPPNALRRLAAPGPHFGREYFGDKSLLTMRAELQPCLFNQLVGTTEYALYNNGVEDPQRYDWATDRGIP